jgi:hypothetical protein
MNEEGGRGLRVPVGGMEVDSLNEANLETLGVRKQGEGRGNERRGRGEMPI